MSSSTPRRSVDNPRSPKHTVPRSDPRAPAAKEPYRRHQGSAASSISSIGGFLDTSSMQQRGSIAESSNNAISTLLQQPIVRTGLVPHTAGPSSGKPPSVKDIPPVILTNIPHIDNAVFKSYLAQAGSLHDAFRRAREGDEVTQLFRRPPTGLKSDDIPEFSSKGAQRRPSAAPGTPRLEGSPLLVSPLEAPPNRRRSSGGVPRRSALVPAPLSTIPNIYFEQDFHLENPRTFDVVSERSEIARPPQQSNGSVASPGSSGRKALATNAILQEKLSWYMDTVEIHLISSISTASNSFFAALGSLRELNSEAAESVSQIQRLRGDLAKLDKEMALSGLKVVALQRKRENMRKLGEVIDQLGDVVNALSRCEDQIGNGNIEDSLNGLSNVEDMIAGERYDESFVDSKKSSLVLQGKFVDLRGLKALEGVNSTIGILRRRIGKGFESRFIEALIKDLRTHVDDVPSGMTFQRWDKASQRHRGNHNRTPSAMPAYLHLNDSLREALKVNLDGLFRSESVMAAASAYREAVLREIKSLIRRHLPSSNDDDNESTISASTQGGRHMTQQEKSSILARNLRALDSKNAEDILKDIYSNVGEALRRLGTQVKVILDVTSSLGGPPANNGFKSPPRSPPAKSPPLPSINSYMKASVSPAAIQQEEVQRALDLSSLLGQAVDIAQAQITKVLKVRTEQTIHLALPRFLRYFTLNRLFVDECEAVSGRSGTALKTVVDGHIKEFLAQYTNVERQRLLQQMDADLWDAKDFGIAENLMLSRVLEGSTNDIDAWSKDSLIWADADGNSDPLQQGRDLSNGSSTGKEKVRGATIDEQKYILPSSAIIVIGGIEGFERFITGIPSIAHEITMSLLEYLKLFNSRSSQLILGAGATRSAGLKNITAKNLALASQALSFVIALIPHVREYVRRHSSNPGTLMTEFDKVKRLYQEHQTGIHDKLADILSGRATTHVEAMKKIDWDAITTSTAINTYMETLVKETTTLHKVLGKHLPDTTIQMIMNPVFASYREQWGKAFGEVELKTAAGKERMLRDAEHFSARIGKLEGGRAVGDFLVTIVKNKAVANQSASASTSEPKTPSQINGQTPPEQPPRPTESENG